MLKTIKVEYKATSNVLEANKWLREIAKYDTIGCDTETSIKYTDKELEEFKKASENMALPKLDRMKARSKYRATALDHPSHVRITHIQIAVSERESYVFILDNAAIARRVLTYLVTTEQRQIWHNAGYDFRLIYYFTGKFPKNYEDTQIYTKTIVNHVEIQKATSGLKELAGPAYGSWGISTDNFHFSQMYEPKVLLYAAIDPCATLWVWNRIVQNIEDE